MELGFTPFTGSEQGKSCEGVLSILVCVCVSVDRTPGVLERHLIDGLNALIGCETRG